MEERWLELKFFYLLRDIFTVKNDMMDVMELVESIQFLGNYSSEAVKQVAQRVLYNLRIKPTTTEFIVIAKTMKLSVDYIRQKTGLSNRQIYQILDDNQTFYFYPRSTSEDLEIIKQFMSTYDILKRAGLPDVR